MVSSCTNQERQEREGGREMEGHSGGVQCSVLPEGVHYPGMCLYDGDGCAYSSDKFCSFF